MKALRWVGLGVGLAAVGTLIATGEVHEIAAALDRGGLKLLLVPVFMLLALAVDARGWQVLVPHAPAWRHFVYARWVGDSVTNLLPVAQVGGIVVKTYLLTRRDVTPGLAVASVLVAVTLAVGGLIVFVLLGLVLMAVQYPHARILLPLTPGFAVFTLAAYLFYRLQRRGTRALPVWLRHRIAAHLPGGGLREDDALGARLREIYASTSRIRRSFVLQLTGWLIGGGEVWLIAHLLGGHLSPVNAVMLESLIQALRNVAFFVPGALGVQEGAFVLAGSALGLPPSMALSISLVKRFREIAMGMPALLVWQLSEGWGGLARLR